MAKTLSQLKNELQVRNGIVGNPMFSNKRLNYIINEAQKQVQTKVIVINESFWFKKAELFANPSPEFPTKCSEIPMARTYAEQITNGTVSVVLGSTLITGTGTAFRTDCKVGDILTGIYSSRITAIVSDTILYVEDEQITTASGIPIGIIRTTSPDLYEKSYKSLRSIHFRPAGLDTDYSSSDFISPESFFTALHNPWKICKVIKPIITYDATSIMISPLVSETIGFPVTVRYIRSVKELVYDHDLIDVPDEYEKLVFNVADIEIKTASGVIVNQQDKEIALKKLYDELYGLQVQSLNADKISAEKENLSSEIE